MKRKDLKTAQLLRAKHLTPEDKIRRASSTTPTELESTASPASNGSSTVSSSASAKAKTMPAQKLTFEEPVSADMPEKTDGRKNKSGKGKATPATAAEPKVPQVPKTNAKQSAAKTAPKPKPALPEQPQPVASPAVGAEQKPKEELQRSLSLGVNSLLNRSGTQESLGSPPSAEAAAAALETLARKEQEQKQKEKEDGTENKRRKRDAATHARKNRFYRTLDSRGPWVHYMTIRFFFGIRTYVHADKLLKSCSYMSVVLKVTIVISYKCCLTSWLHWHPRSKFTAGSLGYGSQCSQWWPSWRETCNKYLLRQ